MGNTPNDTTNDDSIRDHFWDVGSNEDGRHRFIQSMGFTIGGTSEDPVIGAGMDGVLYLKEPSVDIGRIEGFYRNAEGIYQYIPSFLSGTTAAISGSYVNILTVPPSVYGDIFMYTTANGHRQAVTGFFKSDATLCESWSLTNLEQGSSTAKAALKFGNGSEASGLNIRARTDSATDGQLWHYRITYRAL